MIVSPPTITGLKPVISQVGRGEMIMERMIISSPRPNRNKGLPGQRTARERL
jgi:hypothetical protein